jgi:hypothetical protein
MRTMPKVPRLRWARTGSRPMTIAIWVFVVVEAIGIAFVLWTY